MRSILDAIRYALRQFRAAPAFTAAVVLTLALGIGGTTAIFTLIHAVMLKSLPVSDPARLYRIGDGDDCCVEGGPQDEWGMFSYPLFQKLQAAAPEFEQLTAFQAGINRYSVRRQGSTDAPKPLRAEYVTGNYFDTFGIRAFGGRLLTADDDRRGAAPVAVMSHHIWQTEYGGDPAVVGSTLAVEGHPFTIVGIAPPGFFGDTLRGNPPEMWLPLQQEPLVAGAGSLLDQPVSAWLRAIGRLRAGATTAGMAPRLTGLLRQWMQFESGYPANWMPDVIRMLPKQTIAVVPAGAGIGVMKAQYGRSLQILLAVCGLVLLIACANAANLLLARAVARRGQTAVRLAMGASPRHLVLQAMAESLLLAIGGAAAGLIVAVGASRLLLALAFANVQFLPISTTPSPLVLGFATALAIVTGVIFGAAPAWFATRTNPIEALRGAGRATRDGSSVARKTLLVVQATLSVVLVAGAALLARSLNNLEAQDFGYARTGRIVVSMNPLPSTYTLPKLQAVYRQIEERLNRLPGVRGSGLALYNPLTNNWGELILVQGHPPHKMDEEAGASWDRVSATYLQELGVRLVKGRYFAAADNDTSAPVAVVNQSFVKRFFKSDEDPIDQHFGLDMPENAGTFRIVGVVADAKFAGFALDKPARPMFYVPLAQSVAYAQPPMQRLDLMSHFIQAMMLVTDLPPSAVEPQLRKAMAEVDPNLTITGVRTIGEQIALSFSQEQAVAGLAELFGAVALLLAAIGLYSVTAYSVARQTNEIGLRMALGANRGRIVHLVLRGALRWVAAGLAIGVPLALLGGRLIAAQLYGVRYWDPVALAASAAALLTAAIIAALIPAARAASISPMNALRSE